MRLTLIATTCLCLLPAVSDAGNPPRKPNILVILADDLGYGDLSLHGAKDIATPHIDGIAQRGVRFTNAYVSAPYCSPTRAGLLTGRYQQRFGHEFNPALVKNGGKGQGLPTGEVTIADLLRTAGYATALIGKWHLGEDDELQPQRRGFDEFYGFLAGAHSYISSEDKNYGPLVRARKDQALTALPNQDAYLTQTLATEACDFMQRHKGRPFFLYLAFNAVHTPMEAPKKTIESFAKEDDAHRRTYLAMLKEMDDAVGRVLAKLQELNLEEDTLVFFLSDNGGPTTKFAPNGSRNGLLRGSKGDTWEGGIRVPFLVQWKGKLPAGKTIATPVISLDILPTALAAAGQIKAPPAPLDGINLLPWFDGKEAAPDRALFWRFGTQMAIRKGDWSLVRPSMGTKEYEAIAAKPMLFNLATDVAQKNDVTASHPEIARRLQDEWNQWNATLQKPRWPATFKGAVFTTP